MSLLEIPELPARVDELDRRLAELEGRKPVISDSIAIPNTFFVTPEGTKGEGSGMVWAGPWDRETAYAVNEVVRFKGKTYICIQATLAVVGITGLGPSPGAFKAEHWFLPKGRIKPVGRISASEEIVGTLHSTDPKFEEYDATVKDPEHPTVEPTWVAHAWEFWVKEPQVKTTITGFGAYAGHAFYSVRGIVHATIGIDSAGPQRKANMPNEAGTMTEGLMELPAGAFKTGGNERYYLIVWGGTWQEDKPLPEQKLHVTLPLPYALTPGAGIVSGAGNTRPDLDFEHWELVAGA